MAFSRGAAKPENRTPVCRPCTADHHSHCPTAITLHAESGFNSDYECPCYHGDPGMHAQAVAASDAEHEERRTDGWSGGDYFGFRQRGFNPFASVRDVDNYAG